MSSIFGAKKKCPKCGRDDFEFNIKRWNWSCLWRDCNHSEKEPKRFEVRSGEFGMFFYDLFQKKSLPLSEVARLLNLYWLKKDIIL